MRQHKRTWQRHEQRIAEALSTQRNGNTGAATADVVTDWLAVECKSWRSLPAKVTAAMEQAEAAASSEQLPIAVLHQVGQRSQHDLVVMRWGDFLNWFGERQGEGEQQGDCMAT